MYVNLYVYHETYSVGVYIYVYIYINMFLHIRISGYTHVYCGKVNRA